MPFNASQLETLLRSPVFSQIAGGVLATVIALITALGGAAGSSGETNGVSNNPSSSVSAPAPTGKAVDLYNLVDAGEAVKGSVKIGGKTYAKSWSFGYYAHQTVQLNGDYRTLKATVGVIDGQAIGNRTLSLTINGKEFTVDKDNPVRQIEVNVTNVESLKISSGEVIGGLRVGLANPVVYK